MNFLFCGLCALVVTNCSQIYYMIKFLFGIGILVKSGKLAGPLGIKLSLEYTQAD